MNIEQFNIAMLARAMWRAGFLDKDRFDVRLGILYGHVIRNRVQAAAGQVGWLGAILDMESPVTLAYILDCEFPAHYDQPERELRRVEDPEFLKILWEAERLYLNQAVDLIDGALAMSFVPREGSLPTAKATGAAGTPIYFYKTP